MWGLFDSSIKDKIYEALVGWGVSEGLASALDGILILLYLGMAVILVNLTLSFGVVRLIQWVVKKTRVWWDDLLFDRKVIHHLCFVVGLIVIRMMLPLVISAFDISREWIIDVLRKGVDIYIIVACLRFMNALLKATFVIIEHRPAWEGKPIKGLLETMQVALVVVGSMLIIGVIIDKSPFGLLAGLGASAAVISFIFKDSLMGLVAGVQLSANNMLKVGDWIEMPSRGIDGTVIEVSLTTIKVRSWDNTIQTIAPYLLISEPFSNWQAMRDTGGRRVKRSLNIDMNSVQFMDEEAITKLRDNEVIAKLLPNIKTQTEEGEMITNLDLYMRVVNRYIDLHPRVNHTMIAMVRQLQPNEWGLPIELYFFSADVNWVPYEHLQAEVISRIIALAPHFGIRLYQAPSGQDFKTK